MTPSWHGYVGWTFTDSHGNYCGHVGMAFTCLNLDDGWDKALQWLRKPTNLYWFLTRTFNIEVKLF
jgi:hypothetical protein